MLNLSQMVAHRYRASLNIACCLSYQASRHADRPADLYRSCANSPQWNTDVVDTAWTAGSPGPTAAASFRSPDGHGFPQRARPGLDPGSSQCSSVERTPARCLRPGRSGMSRRRPAAAVCGGVRVSSGSEAVGCPSLSPPQKPVRHTPVRNNPPRP